MTTERGDGLAPLDTTKNTASAERKGSMNPYEDDRPTIEEECERILLDADVRMDHMRDLRDEETDREEGGGQG